MIDNIILASKSAIRKKVLEDANFKVRAEPSNVDEEEIYHTVALSLSLLSAIL